ncbi:hypothetical protein L195_g040552, partial [Trifolium pratense]
EKYEEPKSSYHMQICSAIGRSSYSEMFPAKSLIGDGKVVPSNDIGTV